MRASEFITETWSKGYKKSIDCSNPKGFSQRAHCAGRKARRAGKKTKSGSVSESAVTDIHKLADRKDVKWDNDAKFMAKTKELTGKEHLDDLTPQELDKVRAWLQSLNENFADGKKPGRKGLAKRSGVNTKASVSSLRKTAKHSTGEKQRMAHWLANMKAGRKKKGS